MLQTGSFEQLHEIFKNMATLTEQVEKQEICQYIFVDQLRGHLRVKMS